MRVKILLKFSSILLSVFCDLILTLRFTFLFVNNMFVKLTAVCTVGKDINNKLGTFSK